MKLEELRPGDSYLHSENRRYEVITIGEYDVCPADEGTEGAILDATGYEQTGEVRWVLLSDPIIRELTQRMALYVQLDSGSFPKGTEWTREEQDFINNFEPVGK